MRLIEKRFIMTTSLTKKEIIGKALKFTLCILPIAIIGGITTGFYTLETYDAATIDLVMEQVGSTGALIAITAAQSVVYGCFAAFVGYILSYAIGLMKPFGFTKDILVRTVPAIIVCGIIFTLDGPIFGRLIPGVTDLYTDGVSPTYFICSLTYGGVIEEVLMRLFLMSLIAWVLWKIFARRCDKDSIPTWVFVAANVAAALLFAAGHIPATISIFGGLTPMILFRCFLLNGAFGLLFGYFYRRYGIQYAMLGHFGIHLVSKIILIVIL